MLSNTLPIIAAKERGPGPGRYVLPSSCGFAKHDNTKKQNPAYSFGQRLDNLNHWNDASPGPVYWINPKVTRHGLGEARTHSMLTRQQSQKIFQTPAPGTYYPEKVHPPNEQSAPAFSMRARTRMCTTAATPSPNSYTLPNMLGQKVPNKKASHAFSICSRVSNGGYADDFSGTPGPGSYQPVPPSITAKKAPAYSIQSRTNQVADNTKKPGPGTYSPEHVRLNKKKAPVYSMSIRHSEYITPLML
ncbi:Outer dense fiber protein 3-like [Oopsacas minuta]|uniref:Outer dense fiber protein 3-like n=1 Tax=Oopsacas minuta TaxID=111878 RepID=A0AAV7KLD8_9METZ|nr:Outer dense fiber protein 3-like [Oopsacas minuta]